jgi:hypothetical protein
LSAIEELPIFDFRFEIGNRKLEIENPMMPPYPIYCYSRGCDRLAEYKIAARWSDGVTGELKTYALSCSRCLKDWFQRSLKKQAACRLAPGEKLEAPGIYHLEHGQRDQSLRRLTEMEQQLKVEIIVTPPAP